MNYLDKWINDILSRPAIEVNKEIIVKGIWKKHLGPRFEYAAIELKIQPSLEFEVEFSKNLNEPKEEEKEFLDAAIMGVLDIIMTAKTYPIRNIKIIFLFVDIHPIDSSKIAFRNAGRDAGQKIINEMHTS